MARSDRFLNLAENVATLSLGVRRARIGCVVAKGSRVLATAANTSNNIPGNLVTNDRLSKHAEQGAINLCNPQGATIYVVRLMADGSRGMARPCKFCWADLLKVGVRSVVYSDWSGEAKIELVRE